MCRPTTEMSLLEEMDFSRLVPGAGGGIVGGGSGDGSAGGFGPGLGKGGGAGSGNGSGGRGVSFMNTVNAGSTPLPTMQQRQEMEGLNGDGPCDATAEQHLHHGYARASPGDSRASIKIVAERHRSIRTVSRRGCWRPTCKSARYGSEEPYLRRPPA